MRVCADTYDHGRLHTGQINVAWQLHDVTDAEGGFVRRTPTLSASLS